MINMAEMKCILKSDAEKKIAYDGQWKKIFWWAFMKMKWYY